MTWVGLTLKATKTYDDWSIGFAPSTFDMHKKSPSHAHQPHVLYLVLWDRRARILLGRRSSTRDGCAGCRRVETTRGVNEGRTHIPEEAWVSSLIHSKNSQ